MGITEIATLTNVYLKITFGICSGVMAGVRKDPEKVILNPTLQPEKSLKKTPRIIGVQVIRV
jgi:hypothetical protein